MWDIWVCLKIGGPINCGFPFGIPSKPPQKGLPSKWKRSSGPVPTLITPPRLGAGVTSHGPQLNQGVIGCRVELEIWTLVEAFAPKTKTLVQMFRKHQHILSHARVLVSPKRRVEWSSSLPTNFVGSYETLLKGFQRRRWSPGVVLNNSVALVND